MRTLLCLTLIALVCCSVTAEQLNNRPVIGIFAQPYRGDQNAEVSGSIDGAVIGSKGAAMNTDKQYIAASYVKWIESAGGRVVPIDYNISPKDADHLLDSLSAVVFPGGGNYPSASSKYVMKSIVERNKNGRFFPMWGTCMGFQWISQVSPKSLCLSLLLYQVSFSFIFYPVIISCGLPLPLPHPSPSHSSPLSLSLSHYSSSLMKASLRITTHITSLTP